MRNENLNNLPPHLEKPRAFGADILATGFNASRSRCGGLIKEMFFVDQKLRKEKTTVELGIINYMVYILDVAHNYKIWKLIKEFGFPTKKNIDSEALANFCVLIVHQDNDLKLQKQCLKNCGFEKKNKIYLEDRILIHEGKKQKYGTQYKYDEKAKKIIQQPVENIDYANKVRKELGMRSMAEDLKGLTEIRKKQVKK